MGPGAQVAKLDVKSTFRNVPVHLKDWLLPGFEWDGNIYMNTVLPFGLRSA